MPHLLLAAPHKSSGKTTITLGLCAALKARGLAVQPFKKGPDYIDPMWLGRASGRSCINLDFHVMDEGEILHCFTTRDSQADISLIEGNMGLFDSLDVEGHGSNASLAALLKAPVVLVLDVKGATRSIVPIILGFQQFDPRIRIAGLILNKVGGPRHEQRLREAIAHYTAIPILGAIHRDSALGIDERHLGLIPSNEDAEVEERLQAIRQVIANSVDLDALLAIATQAETPVSEIPATEPLAAAKTADIRIGIAQDAAFGFYYPDDLENLRRHGAELVPFDTLHDKQLPAVDALFIGGGFPETQMQALEANRGLRKAIYQAIEDGMPCYAECGGLMYLCRQISWNKETHAMVGIIPADVVMHAKPQGRGYMQLRERDNGLWPGGQEGRTLYAHEFHYSALKNLIPGQTFAYDVQRGQGIDGQHDGFIYKNLLASYVHLRDVDANHWTRRFVDFIRTTLDNRH